MVSHSSLQAGVEKNLCIISNECSFMGSGSFKNALPCPHFRTLQVDLERLST